MRFTFYPQRRRPRARRDENEPGDQRVIADLDCRFVDEASATVKNCDACLGNCCSRSVGTGSVKVLLNRMSAGQSIFAE